MKNQSIATMILAGGKATRLGVICRDVPKPMLLIGGYPFLSYVVAKFLRDGLDPIIILAGHLGEIITQYFTQKPWKDKPVYIHHLDSDDGTYGTGARLLRDARLVDADSILLVNGDTVVDFPVQDLLLQHKSKKALCTIVLTQLSNVPNYGAFLVGDQDQVLASMEGDNMNNYPFYDRSKISWRGSSTGAIIFHRQLLLDLPLVIGQSLEHQLLPSLIAKGKVMAFNNKEKTFFDFGNPDKLSFLQEHPEEVVNVYGSPQVIAKEYRHG